MVKIQLMRICPFRFWAFSGSALFWLLASYPTGAQTPTIVQDTTLPNNSIVTSSGNIITITGGTQVGGNLFHSLREFSVPTGNEAHFNINNAPDIQNIITRVTGGNSSNIDGLIRVIGNANLFLINPKGIIFERNASLDVKGSFVASTANSVRFANGTEFSATNPQAPPLLTINVPPIGLQFGENPGRIVNRSNDPNGAVNLFGSPVGLQVPEGKTLALVGGNVSLEGGNLTVLGGRIELGSVGTGLVNLTEIPQGYALGYTGIENFQDINLSGGALVDASGEGGGSIQVQGRNINLTGNAQIYSVTVGALTGGNLTLDAAESVNLSGGETGLATYTLGTGSAGNLTITTRKLKLESGAFIQTPSSGQGQSGNLLVRATDAVELLGTTADVQFPSGLSAQVASNATGTSGNLTIETGRLTIRDGAVINAETSGTPQAGNVFVKATDVELVGFAIAPDGTIFPSGISTQVKEEAIDNVGNAGNLTIETQRLTLQDGAQIATTGRRNGDGGDLTINASDSINLSGALQNATRQRGSSGIFVSVNSPTDANLPRATGNVGNLTINSPNGQITVENGAKLSASNEGTGEGGTLTLNVRQLTIRDGGLVQSGSFASGSGGTLTVNAAKSIDIIGRGTLGSESVASTLSAEASREAFGKAGDLNITTPSLNVQNGATVTVSSKGSGSAGNLTVTANDIRLDEGSLTAETASLQGEEGANIRLQGLDVLLLQNNSLISAQAFGNARGGNVTIDAPNGSLAAPLLQNSDILARAVAGNGGNITINALGIFGFTQGPATSGNRTNDIDASSQFNNPGTVILNTPDVDPSRGLLELPTGLVNPPELIASGCAAFADERGSSFTVTGRGGLPLSPDQPLSNDVVWTDTRLPIGNGENQRVSNTTIQKKPQKNDRTSIGDRITIAPATGWVFNGKGEVTLISSASNATVGTTPASCAKY